VLTRHSSLLLARFLKKNSGSTRSVYHLDDTSLAYSYFVSEHLEPNGACLDWTTTRESLPFKPCDYD